jgi:phosphonoacetaldehyde hydrolase
VGVAASGNALGWSWEQWQTASEEARTAAVATAGHTLRSAGAHVVIRTVADLQDAIEAIEARILQGEKP